MRELLELRARLLLECNRIDRAACELRERGEDLDVATRLGFRSHVELRIVEREIAKLREAIK